MHSLISVTRTFEKLKIFTYMHAHYRLLKIQVFVLCVSEHKYIDFHRDVKMFMRSRRHVYVQVTYLSIPIRPNVVYAHTQKKKKNYWHFESITYTTLHAGIHGLSHNRHIHICMGNHWR